MGRDSDFNLTLHHYYELLIGFLASRPRQLRTRANLDYEHHLGESAASLGFQCFLDQKPRSRLPPIDFSDPGLI